MEKIEIGKLIRSARWQGGHYAKLELNTLITNFPGENPLWYLLSFFTGQKIYTKDYNPFEIFAKYVETCINQRKEIMSAYKAWRYYEAYSNYDLNDSMLKLSEVIKDMEECETVIKNGGVESCSSEGLKSILDDACNLLQSIKDDLNTCNNGLFSIEKNIKKIEEVLK